MKTWIPDARNFSYLNWKQVDALPRETTLLVLPTAAIEQHGHHLPLATDTLINNLLLGHALGKLPSELPVYALPPVHYGKSNEHLGFPGTLSVSASTFMAVLRDLGASLANARFQKLVLYNTHGGNTALIDVMARDLRAEFGLRTFALHGSGGIQFDGLSPQERAYGFHAGEVETALLLASVPELVDRDGLHHQLHRGCRQARAIASGKRSRNFRLAHARHCVQRGAGRSASGHGGKRSALAGAGRDQAGGGPGSDGALPKSRQAMSTGEARWIDCGNGVRLERGVHCRMSDGVELVSDHYYPPDAGRNPTLLMRQPYGRDIASTVVFAHPVWFARHGYNVVIQDVRGRGDSGGEFYPFRHEGRDGAETIAWLRTRPEGNGRIGMYGFSYQGMTQLLAAAAQPEGLICIAPGMTACDLYHGWFYHHGALRLASSLGWGLQMMKADARRKQLREASDRLEQAWANLAAQTAVLPFREHPALHSEGVPQYVLDWFDHHEPGEYWTSLDVSQSLERITVPALHISGWYDTYLKGSIDGFVSLSKQCGHRICARAPISDRRALATYPVGRSHRRHGLWTGSLARHGCDPAALVQSLAQGFGRIQQRTAHSLLCAGRKSLAAG